MEGREDVALQPRKSFILRQGGLEDWKAIVDGERGTSQRMVQETWYQLEK